MLKLVNFPPPKSKIALVDFEFTARLPVNSDIIIANKFLGSQEHDLIRPNNFYSVFVKPVKSQNNLLLIEYL
jgi:hypothetical protein